MTTREHTAKEWPLLMKGPLVRAVCLGRKDVTRRLDLRWLKAKPGSRIWVKETWCVGMGYDGLPPSQLPTDGLPERGIRHHYLAAGAKPYWAGKTRVSIHMPKAFARLWLTVVATREERVQDITDQDALREGLAAITKDGKLVKYGIPDRDGLPGRDNDGWEWQDWNTSPRVAFQRLWDSINGDDQATCWAANPTVARIEFTRAEAPCSR